MTDHNTNLLILETLKKIAVAINGQAEALNNILATQASILEHLKLSGKPKERLSEKTGPSPKLKLIKLASGQKNDPGGDPER